MDGRAGVRGLWESDRRQRTIETMGRGLDGARSCFRVAMMGAHRNLLYSRVLQRERLLKLQKGMGRQTRSGKRAVKCIQKSDVMREVERGTFLPLSSPAV